MRIAIVGSGAMGCRYGSALKKAGADVWLYDIWKDHVDAINSQGLTVHDGNSTERVKIDATSIMDEIPHPDLVMIFTKSTHTEGAMIEALKIMNRNTTVMTLQNGLGNIDVISKYTSRENIIAGVTNYASDLMGPGEIEAKGSGITKLMSLGEESGEISETVNRLLNEGGINSEISDEVMVDVWEKVAFNAALNTLTALTFLTVGQLGGTLEGFELARTISSEVVAVANACGVEAREDKVHEVIESVFDPEMSGDHKPSMLQDRMFKRKTEIEYICGSVLEMARQHGIRADHIETVYKLIRIIEKNYDNQVVN